MMCHYPDPGRCFWLVEANFLRNTTPLEIPSSFPHFKNFLVLKIPSNTGTSNHFHKGVWRFSGSMHCKPQQEAKNANSTYTFITAPYEIQQILCTILLWIYLAAHSPQASLIFLHKFSTFFTLSTCFSDFIPGILYFFVFLLFVTFISTLWWLLLFTFILWDGIVIL